MRLVTFGDSFTAGYGVNDGPKWSGVGHPDTFEDLYRKMNSWPRFLANKFDIQFINMGSCAIGNNDMYKIIKENLDELLEDDLIIIAFTYPYRNATSANSDYKNIDNILKNYPNRFYFNAFYPMFTDELPESDLDFSKFIKPEYTFSLYLSEVEKRINKPLFQLNSWYNPESKDGAHHPNYEGYRHIAEFVYSEIKDKVNLL